MLIIFTLPYANGIVDRTYYDLLGVPCNVQPNQLKKAFRKLSQEHHPDRNANSKLFRDINSAYEVLANRELRSKYDKHGPNFRNRVQEDHGFGGFFFQSQEESDQPQPLVIQLPIPLKDVYTGATYRIIADSNRACPHCHGRGTDRKEDLATCQQCGGKGTVQRRVNHYGMVQIYRQHCNRCGGKGMIFKSTCHVCKSSKLVRSTQSFQIEIPRGGSDSQIVLVNAGEQQSEGGIRDIIVRVKVVVPDNWKRVGDLNLQLKLNITLQESILGFSRQIEHLDGHKFTLTHSGVATAGKRVTVQKEGMVNEQGARGKLVVILGVVIEEFQGWQLDLWQQVFRGVRS